MKAGAALGAITLFAAVGAAWTDSAVTADEIRIYCSGAPAAAVKSIAADFAKSNGARFHFTVAQPATIEHDLARGERADVVVLPMPIVSKMMAAGILRADTAVALAQVGIGVAIRAGAKPPDISSPAAIRKLLIEARSVVYPDPHSGGGSAGRAIARMIDRMGLSDVVRPKLTLKSAIGGGVALVASGQVEIGLFNASEIIAVKGAMLVGLLPPELQHFIVFGAAIATGSAAPGAATAFIKRLVDPKSRPAWQAAALEPAAP